MRAETPRWPIGLADYAVYGGAAAQLTTSLSDCFCLRVSSVARYVTLRCISMTSFELATTATPAGIIAIGHCPGRLLQRQGHPPFGAGASATLAGLTARARPEARPEVRAANLVKGVCRKDRELR